MAAISLFDRFKRMHKLLRMHIPFSMSNTQKYALPMDFQFYFHFFTFEPF